MSRLVKNYYNNCVKMKKKIIMYLYLIFIAIPMAKGAIPGTFFWKPRLGLDLSIPTTGILETWRSREEPVSLVYIESQCPLRGLPQGYGAAHEIYAQLRQSSVCDYKFSMSVSLPTRENIEEGIVVLMDGYNAGMTVISLAAGASSSQHSPHFDPMSGFFYTNVYRWALRYISLIPFWMGGSGGNYCDTHRVWRRRYYYMDEFIPSWLQKAIFWVEKKDWEKEELDYKRFKKFAEPAFGKYYRYPNKVFNDFKSHETVETMDQPASSSLSVL